MMYDQFRFPDNPQGFEWNFIVWNWNEIFNMDFHINITNIMFTAEYTVMAIGIILYLKGKTIGPGKLEVLIFVYCFIMNLPSLLLVNERYGCDTPAYLNQAG